MAGFRPVDEHLLSRAGFLDLVEERVRTPDGDEVVRFTVRHPGAVVIVALEDDERVVLVRQYRIAARAELLELPAGKREPDEEPEATARRELEEETGLLAGRWDRLVGFYNSPGFSDEYSHVYLARDLEVSERDLETRAEERHMDVERVALGDLDRLLSAGEIVDAKTIIGTTLARAFLRGERTGRR